MTRISKLLFFLMFGITYLYGQTIKADFRHRPPEMIVDASGVSGPLIEILNVAAKKIGHRVQWKKAMFPNSLKDLESGALDILPRTLKTKKRDLFINYLGPIGFQDKTILFLVKKGEEKLINTYEDLAKLKIGVRIKTAYFEKFNLDSTLDKIETINDSNMVRMFDRYRFDTMAVLDIDSIEFALKKNKITNYAYANYRFKQKIANFYAMSKKSKVNKLQFSLGNTLKEMANSGEIRVIYEKYGVLPPLQ